MALFPLTEGAIATLSSGDADPAVFMPVLQVADFRLVPSQPKNTIERYRILLSDGNFVMQGILAPRHNEMVKSEKLRKGSLVKLTQFACNNIQNRMIVAVLDLDVIVERCDPIGVPKPYPVKTEGAPGQLMNPPSYISTSSNSFFIFSVSGLGLSNPFILEPSQSSQASNNISQIRTPDCLEMASIPLTEDAIAILSSGNAHQTNFKPVLQVTDIFPLTTLILNTERYRIVLSDGKFSQQGLLASRHNELVKSEKLRKGSIVQLVQFICDTTKNRMIIIINNLDVLAERCGPIGLPKQYPVKTEENASTPDQPMNAPTNSSGSLMSISSSDADCPLFCLLLTVPSLSLKLSISAEQTTNIISQTQNLHGLRMSPIPLTEGAIAILSSSDVNETTIKPVFQVADKRLVNTQNQKNERCRVLLSDGKFTQQGLLSTQLNDLVKSEKLQKGSIVQLTLFASSITQDRRIIVIVDLDVVVSRCDPIGQPKQYPARSRG